ncbi:Eco57I restriction-modification methylase domain-containing protein [Actinotignum urinale]|uniref:DEAD/DEAH box helicase family protein n=1 Tax=Actinotignum urinale TaxID=190146 RepID=UPI002A8325FD|nr:Eco57I restriction-modification methylase domain-containing protein [Actinotignum urinale]MDY5151013.1 Eco57I restriction-modification methylase domain-containing protein [Actinotignum urinale]
MKENKIEAIDILDRIIIGRVEPHIYAFTTNTVPNYLKVGDTYRPVSKRLNEWRVFFPELEKQYENKAIIDEETYFRDYAIHQYLENDLNKERLKQADLEDDIYYSKEFFKETEIEDIDNAIEDIKGNYQANSSKYEYYSSKNKLPQTYHYERGGNWDLRPNQETAVDSFINAVKSGRRNLLMYAVMRFGKSFTSLCCALKMNAKTVLVVSAKADVKDEWKKTVESAGNFFEYVFLESSDLLANENVISEKHSEGKKVVIFLTLQDLQGDNIKDKHKELFGEQIDLLIVDETHFGARAESFGKILKNAGYDKTDEKNISKLEDENIDLVDADVEIKKINAKIRLHLSGTPYRILMGNEFEKEDIISFVQFSDIVKEQEEWDRKYLNNDDVNEWDNPYYGFPQMVRFAFNPNKSSREKMEALRKSGVSFAFSKLLEPISIKKDAINQGHKKFINESEILDLLRVIDGSKEDEELLGFLDYDKIKEGKMCRHMVMVLPYCASCDAMEELIRTNKDIFKNLNEYEIINISGVEARREYSKPDDIKRKIKDCEEKNQKTLTLTVNRMLTGSTVEQWDTMLYFKDTASPQEYDQSIFRLQNQYVRTLSSENGFIKENLKPQTLLVDFDPNRLFRMQEQKSLIYNVNTEENGNSKLKERIVEELRISPIIMMNHNKIKQVDATNILEAVSEYNNQRSVSDEVVDIPVDLALLNDVDIRKVIEAQAEFNSKQGLTIDPNQGDGEDLDIEEPKDDKKDSGDRKDTPTEDYTETKTDDDVKKLESQIKTYYQRLLFYSFLTKDKVSSLDDILNTLDKFDNQRIAKNLYLEKGVLQKISDRMDPFKRSSLDYKIQNISRLASDECVAPLDRAMTSIKKFNRMSESEVITPSKVCDEMVALLPEEGLREIVDKEDKLLDIASKSGEYAVSLYKRLTTELGYSHEDVENIIYSIPTSSIAYEFTRKFYEILNLNVDNIASGFNAYDLIEVKDENGEVDNTKINNLLKQDKTFSEITLKDEIKVGDRKVRFGAIVGNPPYQEIISKSKGNKSLGKQLFPNYIKLSMDITDVYATLITPSKWFTADAQDNSFPKLREYAKRNNHFKKIKTMANGASVFEGTELGSVNYFLFEKQYTGNTEFIHDKEENSAYRPLFEEDMEQIISMNSMVSILNKVRNHEDFDTLMTITKGRNAFGITGKEATGKTSETYFDGSYSVRCSYERIRYTNEEEITKNKELANRYKVFMSKANGAAGILGEKDEVAILGKPYIGSNRSVCTDSLIPIGDFSTEQEAINLSKYLLTKFLRFMVGILKSSQNIYQIVYKFVPMQDFTNQSDIDWENTIDEIDEQLFDKYGLSNEEREYIKSSIKEM